jgi:hypothetical protein
MRTRALSFVAATAALAFGGLLVASPASAATLPDGQHITIVEQIQGSPGGSRMWTVSPVDALTTDNKPVQSPIDIEAIDVNDDGFGYATESRFDGETTRTAWLWKADANTGVLSDPVQILLANQTIVSECQGLDYSGGVITVACTDNAFNGDPQNGYLGEVSTAGVFTPHFNSQSQEDVTLDFTAVAVNPVDGQLWAFTEDDGWPVDRSADPWILGTIVPLEGSDRVDGADFDRDGQLFVVAASEGSRIYTLDPTNGQFLFIGELNDGTNAVTPVHAVTVWGKVALPATGPADILPIGLGTALLMLAGAAFVATGRIQRRADA